MSNWTAGALPGTVRLNGATLVQDADYFPSLRADAQELWLTLGRALAGATNRLEILPAPGAPPPADPVSVTVTRAGAGSGTVSSDPPGIDCGATCATAYASGTLVTLTATPTADSVFAGWSGGGCSGTGSCVVTVTTAITVTATFAPALPTLTLALDTVTFAPGQALALTARLTPGPAAMLVDAYVVIRLPDGRLLSLTLDGRLVPGIVPIATGFTPVALERELLRYTFGGQEPAGPYTWMSALTLAGTGSVIGAIRETPFAFAP